MGRLIYGPQSLEIELDDRLLAHLKVAMLAKMRRNESFSLSWTEPESSGHGRSSVWVHPTTPLHFRFSGSKRPSLNRAWIEQFMAGANNTGEMNIIPEPDGSSPDERSAGRTSP
ncbi:hypothetical protein [Rathayibacter toxicus]|uniref:ATP-dependent DNA ligase n=1 Tax=Rathayibacter toxicus TaxID=145458 RepID=A0A0C5BCZ6_9MICO|nr:hypothetical protein [Rathayibacter toxicus]AJM77031.1 hypothetical protein TI83_01710 [Rathayibacter toxicus]ALS57165.1 hypothetical protein APU90_04780 [Rathayibacter toxicus]KKM46030.1 hypothetical protein VT73_02725 [Rathayibacter toxicus]PPG22961.1 ATP-dependent DNA ligase [Rathayibacter toxicus]PPG47542.1 ATP-dependent DNA ligase [Rathayibacter toxicus]